MSVFRRICSLYSLVFVVVFLLAACSHDDVAATPTTEPVANTPSEPAVTPPVEPAASTPGEPAAIPATEPDPATAPKPVIAPPVEPAPSAPPEAKPNDTFTLKPGQSANVAASTQLHYVRMVNDSRCPPDVQCIWAGEVTIELTLDTGKEKQTFTMKDDEKAATIMGYQIELISIDRNHLINIRVKKI